MLAQLAQLALFGLSTCDHHCVNYQNRVNVRVINTPVGFKCILESSLCFVVNNRTTGQTLLQIHAKYPRHQKRCKVQMNHQKQTLKPCKWALCDLKVIFRVKQQLNMATDGKGFEYTSRALL